jgi:hypothetical protein
VARHRRLKRVFGVEIERCARCGGKLRIIASIEEPHPAVLEGLGLVYGSTAAALIVQRRRREGPAPVQVPGGIAIAVLSLVTCVALLFTTSRQAVRDVVIVVAIGFAIRTFVRSRAARSTVRPGG